MITPLQKAQLIAEGGYPPELMDTCKSIASFLKADKQSAEDEHALNMAYLLFVEHPSFQLYNNRSLKVIADNFSEEYVNDILQINISMQKAPFDENLMSDEAKNIERFDRLSDSGKRVLLACLADEFNELKKNNTYGDPAAPIVHVASRMILADSLSSAAPGIMRVIDDLAVDIYAKYAPKWGKRLKSENVFFHLLASCLVHQFETDNKDNVPGGQFHGQSVGRVDMEKFVNNPAMPNTYPYIDETQTYLPKRLHQFLQASLWAGKGLDPAQAGFLLRALIIHANRRNLIARPVCDKMVTELIDYVCDTANVQDLQNIFYPRSKIDHDEYVYYSKNISSYLQNKVLDRLCTEEEVKNCVSPRPPRQNNSQTKRERD